MTHPFIRFFETALTNSTVTDNVVLAEAENLKAKGYDCREIHDVLLKFHKGRIDDLDNEITEEAVGEFSRYLE